MIISNTGNFVFFHNPKVAGASVHKSLEGFHSSAVAGWGVDTDGRVRAHHGIDEFATLYPEEWARIESWRFYALWRDPLSRFVSSFGQHSRMYGTVDIRFASPEQTRAYLWDVIEDLGRYGGAEGILGQGKYTAFRPQWIYLHSDDHDIDIHAYPMAELERMYLDIEDRTGQSIERIRINEKERLDLPAPLAKLLGRGDLARRLGRLPGAGPAKAWLKSTFKAARGSAAPAAQASKESGPKNGAAKPAPGNDLGLSAEDQAQMAGFVETFYARDHELLKGLSQSPAPSSTATAS